MSDRAEHMKIANRSRTRPMHNMTNPTSRVYLALRTTVLVLLLVTLAHAQTKPADIESRVEAIVSQMTLEEKVALLGGVDGSFTRGVPRLNVPRFKMADGPFGVRNSGPDTAVAGGIALAATWNSALAQKVGTELGRDARAKGVHFLLAPGVNIYRAPWNGRNFEYFGEDPYLASRITVGFINGVQNQGVSATVKHYLGNNSEFARHSTDSVIDERTMREIYMPAFEAAVKEAHVGAVMDSYNKTDGQYMAQNNHLNNEVLKKEWGFDGILVSDWFANYTTLDAVNAGLDLEMPVALHMNRESLLPAIQQGKISMATIDDKVRRILRIGARFGWLDHDQLDLSVPRYNQQGRHVALQTARESMVLLKNERSLLPLTKKAIKSIAVIGPDAYPAAAVGGGSARVQPFQSVSFLEGLSNYLGQPGNVFYAAGLSTLHEWAEATQFMTAETGGQHGLQAEYFQGIELKGPAAVTRTEQHIDFGPDSRAAFPDGTASDRWTGYYLPTSAGSYDVFVASTGEDGGYFRLYIDDKLIFDQWNSGMTMVPWTTLSFETTPHKIVLEHRGRSRRPTSILQLGIMQHDAVVSAEAKKLAATAEVVVLAVGFDAESEGEGADRTFHLPPGQDELVRQIAAINKNVVLLITAGGAVDMTPWVDSVPVVLQTWYPGQEGGTALAEILFGDVNPSGRLPVTFERQEKDNPVHDSYYSSDSSKQVVYKEGVFVGYRGYEHNGAKPLFPFGYGLSYTTFAYRNLSVVRAGNNVAVSFDITNTGKREGDEVAQVYVGDKHAKVPRPARELKGFAKIHLRPGETRHITVKLDRRAFSYYDINSKQWHMDPGEFDILVGQSVEEIKLRGKLALNEADLKNF
jgi:beta-glucosidase